MEHVIRQGIGEAMQTVEGISGFETHLVWDPAWHPGMIEQDVFQA
jgi:metal-sulfur cluster biosynthetic enzyme